MPQRIFNQRLKRIAGRGQGERLLADTDFAPVFKGTDALLQKQIAVHGVQLVAQRRQLLLAEIVVDQPVQRGQHFGHLVLAVAAGQPLDVVQRVVQEVRIDAAEQQLVFQLGVFLRLDLGLADQPADVAAHLIKLSAEFVQFRAVAARRIQLGGLHGADLLRKFPNGAVDLPPDEPRQKDEQRQTGRQQERSLNIERKINAVIVALIDGPHERPAAVFGVQYVVIRERAALRKRMEGRAAGQKRLVGGAAYNALAVQQGLFHIKGLVVDVVERIEQILHKVRGGLDIDGEMPLLQDGRKGTAQRYDDVVFEAAERFVRRVNRGAPPGRQRRKHVVQIGAREPLGGNERFVVVQINQRDQADAGRGVNIGIERLFNIALHLRLRNGVPPGQNLVQLIGDRTAVIGNIDGQLIGRVQHIAQLVRAHFQRQEEAVIDALIDDLRHVGAGNRKKEQHDEQRHQRQYGDQPVPN